MRYVKKTCILRQLKNGFSADGKSLSGIVKAEQYAQSMGVELSTANLAPTTTGAYYCVIADKLKRHKLLALEDGNRFSFHCDMDIAEGFYAVLCFLSTGATPIAYGACGNLPYDIFTLVRQVFSSPNQEQKPPLNKDMPPMNSKITPIYNDELVATDNYFEKEKINHAQDSATQSGNHAPTESGNQNQRETPRDDPTPNAHDEGVRHAFGTETDGYYQSIRGELSALFEKYPSDETLTSAYPASEWVRVKGEADTPQELVGLIYESGLVKYICYAVPAREETPQEIKDTAYFGPASPFTPDIGFFVLYQSAATGETIANKEL